VLVQEFWKKWVRDYLNTLQHRPKWCKPQDNLKVGDIVLLKDENLSVSNLSEEFPLEGDMANEVSNWLKCTKTCAEFKARLENKVQYFKSVEGVVVKIDRERCIKIDVDKIRAAKKRRSS